jgi:NTE family protein
MRFSNKRKKLNLALQGGGAHGAFTWGVLDQLLLDEEIQIGWMSATSAGAFNAVAVAHGLSTGGRQTARETIKTFWSEVESAGVPDLMRLNPLLSSLVRKASPLGVFSPYSFNPLGFDPLRNILKKHIDFDAIRANKSLNIMIAATDVETGRARIFQRDELTIDVVLASACLPTLHHAVMIDGRAYWDGGFSANPDLLNMAAESPVGDTLLVLLNPVRSPEVPKTASSIEERVSTITFNQALLRDIDTIVRAQSMNSGWFASRGTAMARLKAHRFHLIEAGRHTSELGAESKIMPDREVLRQLYHGGLLEAERWMSANKRAIGEQATVSLADHFFASKDLGHVEQGDLEGGADAPASPLAKSA